MEATARAELAKAIVDTYTAREASYDPAKGRYKLDYRTAFEQSGADPELVHVVVSLLVAGYCEPLEWALSTVSK